MLNLCCFFIGFLIFFVFFGEMRKNLQKFWFELIFLQNFGEFRVFQVENWRFLEFWKINLTKILILC